MNVTDSTGAAASDITNSNGIAVVPVSDSNIIDANGNAQVKDDTAMDWIKGYADGSFKPDNNITRAEVVAIVNRVTDREADTEYVNKNLSSLNRFDDLTDKGYWAYFDILSAANTHMAVNNANGETWVK